VVAHLGAVFLLPEMIHPFGGSVKTVYVFSAILIMAKYKREGICPEERKELMWMIF